MAKTYKQLMEEARQAVPEVTIDEVKSRVERGEKWALLDVRATVPSLSASSMNTDANGNGPKLWARNGPLSPESAVRVLATAVAGTCTQSPLIAASIASLYFAGAAMPSAASSAGLPPPSAAPNNDLSQN